MRPDDLRAALDRLTAPAPHLRWRLAAAGDPLADGELACASLAADPDALATAVAASAAGRGSDDPQVLASLWWQAYAYRVAGTALACWLVSGVAPDARVEAMAVGVARSRPSSVVYLTADPAEPGPHPGTRGNDSRSGTLEAVASGPRTPLPRDPVSGSHCLGDVGGGTVELAGFVDRLFAGHLDLVAASLRARHSLGRGLVWGNVAAGCASAAGSVRTAVGPPWRHRLDAFLAATPPDLAAFGAWTDPAGDPTDAPDPTTADGPAYRRTTCCLWWKTSVAAGALCADCSLTRSPNETAPA